ncbi:hypothetical protein PIB30_042807 [Stylosanthes scabra]|uniref:Uncharacterized protein n=1 Tax=Stylosanthes scabra TaxID=79078 RepID=A0ABU6SG20_9FABA|nr:hypothetical protein [Stylosanthes scabra]
MSDKFRSSIASSTHRVNGSDPVVKGCKDQKLLMKTTPNKQLDFNRELQFPELHPNCRLAHIIWVKINWRMMKRNKLANRDLSLELCGPLEDYARPKKRQILSP